jgi:hypothetical protein
MTKYDKRIQIHKKFEKNKDINTSVQPSFCNDIYDIYRHYIFYFIKISAPSETLSAKFLRIR